MCSSSKHFFDAACYCQHKNVAMVSEYLFAFAANLAFAGELYLKALLIRYSNDKMFCEGHNLQILYDSLQDEATKNKIRELYDFEFHIHPFEEMLEWHKNAFSDWRYGFSATNDLSIQSTDFGVFVRTLKRLCNDINN